MTIILTKIDYKLSNFINVLKNSIMSESAESDESAIFKMAKYLELSSEDFLDEMIEFAQEATEVECPEDENGHGQPSADQAKKIETEMRDFFREVIEKVCQSLIDSGVTVSMKIVESALKKELKEDYVVNKLTQIEQDNTENAKS